MLLFACLTDLDGCEEGATCIGIGVSWLLISPDPRPNLKVVGPHTVCRPLVLQQTAATAVIRQQSSDQGVPPRGTRKYNNIPGVVTSLDLRGTRFVANHHPAKKHSEGGSDSKVDHPQQLLALSPIFNHQQSIEIGRYCG